MKIKFNNSTNYFFARKNKILRLIMRCFIFFLCTTVFSLSSGDILSQNVNVTIEKDITLTIDEIFDLLRDQTDYTFIYHENLFDNMPKVLIKKGIIKANKLLETSLSEGNFKINISDNNIISVAKNQQGEILSQEVEISGTIKDANGQPLPGANVIEKGTTNGVTTDFDGNFTLSVSNKSAILVVSYVGFTTKEVGVENKTELNIVLEEDAAALEEVVVVGYGTQTKRAVTGAVSTISAEDLGEGSSDAVTRSLAGKVAGVQIQQTTGAPGGNLSIKVRGAASLSAGNGPLYVIDGFPLDNSNLDGNNGGFNPLSSINPDDIASIDILKDASAAAIYGSRGANGVVMITTKKGKEGKPSITFNTSVGVQNVLKKLDMLNGDEYLDLITEAYNNARATNNPTLGFPDFVNDPQYRGVNTDWQDEIFTTALVSNYQLSASGGTENVKYFVSGGYLKEEGVIISSGFERVSFRANFDADITDKLKWGLNFTPSYTENDEVNAEGHWANNSVINVALVSAPFLRPDQNNQDFVNSTANYDCCDVVNPRLAARNYDASSTAFRNLLNTYLEYEVVDDLKFKTSIGFDVLDFERNVFDPADIRRRSNDNVAESVKTSKRSLLNENILNYNVDIGENHNVTALAGFTFQKFRQQENRIGASGLTNTIIHTINDFTKVNEAYSEIEEWSLVSYLARLNYSYKNRYFLTGTFRRDGSSRFGTDVRYANFPSASFSWLASDEKFMEKADFINQLKFRVSYGEVGNNNIGNYASKGLLTTNNYVLGSGNGTSVSGVSPGNIANPSLTWETTIQKNIGMDLSLFQNKVTLTADYYDSETEALLLEVPIPRSTGFQSALQNLGRIRNSGIELSAGVRGYSEKFEWDANFNIAFNKNEILQLGPEGDPIRDGSGAGNIFINEVGGELGAFNVYRQIGIFQTEDEIANSATWENVPTFPGDVKYKDLNDDGVITTEDREVVGSGNPDFTWGLTTNFSYKNLDLNIVFNGVSGNYISNISQRFLNNLEGNQNQVAAVKNRWVSPEQPGNGVIPRANRSTSGNNNLPESDRWLEDGSFARLQNVTLGYTVQSDFVKKIGLSSCRFTLTGSNLFYLTDYSGYNPEVSFSGSSSLNGGADYGSYPLTRRFTFGLKLGF